jgi:hypothetical protein
MMIKECPTCKRTYSDERITFCLADGSLLSAPFDSEATQHLPASNNTNQPPTEVMNPASTSNSLPPTQPVIEASDVQPTMTSPFPAPLPKQGISQPSPAGQRSHRVPRYTGIIIGLSLVVILAYAGLYWYQQRVTTEFTSPSAAARAFVEACKNKDVEGLKRTLNKVQLQVFEEVARDKNISLDEYLKQSLENDKWYDGDIQEIRNEEISGDKATLEVKINGTWRTRIFIKENGGWKRFG